MARFEGDLETAFTNGDPESVLDFLALRSCQRQRGEAQEDPVCPLPLFTAHGDVAAIVRDLTIDDAISLCFADLPSGYGDTVTSSAPVAMPTVPEKKLTDPAKAASSVHRHPSDTRRLPASSGKPPAGEDSPQSVRSHSRDKPRGFLSSLLGRGHKGRRGGSQRNSAHHQNDEPSKPWNQPGSVFSSEKDPRKNSVTNESVSHTTTHHHVATVRKSEMLLDVSVEDHPHHVLGRVQDRTVMKDKHQDNPQVANRNIGHLTDDIDPVGAATHCFQHPHTNILGTVEHNLEPVAQNSIHAAAVPGTFTRGDRRLSTESEAVLGLHCEGHSGLHFISNQAGKPGSTQQVMSAGHSHDERKLLSSETFLQASNSPATENNAGTGQAPQYPQESQGKTGEKSISQTPWAGLCQGIDAFIDFERDPNVEVPLDSHLSAQFDFEGRASKAGSRGNGAASEHHENKLIATERPEGPKMMSQEPALFSGETSSRPGKGESDPGTANDVTVASCDSSPQNTHRCSEAPPLVPSTVYTSTQTEGASSGVLKCSIPTVDNCLRAALNQLSSISECSTCHDAILRISSVLEKLLTEIEEGGASSEKDDVIQNTCIILESFSHGHTPQVPYERQTDNGLSDRTVIGHSIEGLSPRNADAAKNGEPEKKGKSKYENIAIEVSQRDASKVPMSSKRPEHAPKRSRHSGSGKRQTMPSRACGDSDSDSASTVTSEPLTVMSFQGEHRSSGSSKLSRCSDNSISARNSSSKRGGDRGGARTDPLSSTAPARMNSEPAPASGLQTAADVLAMNSATTANTPLTSRATARSRKDSRSSGSLSRSNREADRDCESFLTSSWSEMTSVSSMSDVVTSADESSYYSGDEDNDDDDDEEEEESNDATAVVKLGLLDEDRDDIELRHHRLQRHLAAVLRQSSAPATAVETVVAATGERLNSQERHGGHINQGALYPFLHTGDSLSGLAPGQGPLASSVFSAPGPGPGEDHTRSSAGLHASDASAGREARSLRKGRKGAAPRLFSPDRQVSLVSARQMTSGEFREGYDRSTDVTKAKRSQLDGDIPWDLIPCSDTDDDARSDKAWYNVTSEEENATRAYDSDTDSSTIVSDW